MSINNTSMKLQFRRDKSNRKQWKWSNDSKWRMIYYNNNLTKSFLTSFRKVNKKNNKNILKSDLPNHLLSNLKQQKKLINFETGRLNNLTRKNERTYYKNEIKAGIQRVNNGDISKYKINTEILSGHEILETLRKNMKFTDYGVYLQIGAERIRAAEEFLNHFIDRNTPEYDPYYRKFLETNNKKNNITILQVGNNEITTKNIEGAFFPKYHKTKLDLSRYQIFTAQQVKNARIIDKYGNIHQPLYNDNCLIHAFKMAGIAEEKINALKHMTTKGFIPQRRLKEIAKKIERKIIVERICRNNLRSIYGKGEPLELGLLNGHYFLNEEIRNKEGYQVNSYALQNYSKIKNYENWNEIMKIKESGKIKIDRRKFILTSYKLIKRLWEYKEEVLEKIPDEDMMDIQYYKSDELEFSNLEYNDSDVREVIRPKNNKSLKDFVRVFFDFETYNNKNETDEAGNFIITPYCLCAAFEDRPTIKFWGKDCAVKFLNYLRYKTNNKKKFLLIAHNLNFDYRFLVKTNRLYQINEIVKDGKVIASKAIMYVKNGANIQLKFKCSYRIIPEPLKKFGKMFKLKQAKEIMPYGLYDKILSKYPNMDENFKIPIKSAFKFLKQSEQKQFFMNIKKWNMLEIVNKKMYFTPGAYATKYCELDCEVLRDGYLKFRKWLLNEPFELDIDNIVTISSLADKFLKKEGAFDGCYELSGIPRQFIQKCVVGGRTMTANNKPQISTHKQTRIVDFDAVSLYPSAMVRMPGFLMGKPKILKNKTKSFLQGVDGYFLRICIKEVGKTYDFPCMSYKNEKGIRNWTNDMVGQICFVDKTTLEDWEKFQKIKYEIIDGYYFNEGRNSNIKTIMKTMFDERLKKKKEQNPIQAVYKLIMNSAYGKTCLKEITTKTKVLEGEKNYNKYLYKNYNQIQQGTQLFGTDLFRIEENKAVNEHFNLVQCGVEVLSMSKRIMFEVMCLAEDLKMKMYITDTDSIHMDQKDVAKLASKFEKKYERKLIGKYLGQFHSDFEMEGAVNEVYSDYSIFLGKKMYLDRINGIDKNGKKLVDYHVRMKGATENSIWHSVKKNYNGKIEKLYLNIVKGGKQKFNMLMGEDDLNKPKFRFKKDGTGVSLIDFTRTVSIKNAKDAVTHNPGIKKNKLLLI